MTSTADELTTLRAEIAALRARLAARDGTSTHPRPRPRWRRAVPAAALIVIGALLAPVTVVAVWAEREASSTEAFVETFAPLARDGSVQALVASRTVAVINERLDVSQLTGTVFDGIAQLDLPPRAKDALGALQAPATAGIEGLITSTVDRFVASEQFAELWDRLLRTGHTQMVASLRGDRDAAVSIGGDGAIGIQLGPVVAEVKSRLIERGLTFAARIPSVDRTLVIATSDAAVRAQTAFAVVQIVAGWLPWILVATIGLGVVTAHRRARALTLAAVGVAVTMIVTLVAVGVGRVQTVHALAPDLMPRNAARTIYDGVVAFVASAAVAGTVLALSVALVSWYAGSSSSARTVRGSFVRAAGSLRAAAEQRGLTTGRVGVLVSRGRVVIRTLVAIAAAAVIVIHRPLTPGLIAWTLVGALVVVAGTELVGRPSAPRTGVSPGTDDPAPSSAH
jgi:hypothetical protein